MWNIHGVIPPVGYNSETERDRSPYTVSMKRFVKDFATSAARIDILEGLITYRSKLCGLGLNGGFQWVDGSFTEDIETLQNRPPNDVDVVTFADFSKIREDTSDVGVITDAATVKNTYKVDAFIVDLSKAPERIVQDCTYWYSMWSHQRDTRQWKGFFEIPLGDDTTAKQILEGIKNDYT